MLLAIDAGNTNTVFAVFDGKKIVGSCRLSANRKRTADEYAISLVQFFQLNSIEYKNIDSVIISSVVPQSIFAMKTFCKNYIGVEPLIIGEGNVELGLGVKVDRPSEVGADRLVNSVAAYKKFGGNVIIIDFGTATTFDVIDESGNYIGGVISPGINLSLEALHVAAAKLPEIDVKRPENVIGKSTISAMQSGIYWGYVGLIEGIVSRIKNERAVAMKVVATGGLAPLFFKATNVIEELESDLTIEGLKQIFEMNR